MNVQLKQSTASMSEKLFICISSYSFSLKPDSLGCNNSMEFLGKQMKDNEMCMGDVHHFYTMKLSLSSLFWKQYFSQNFSRDFHRAFLYGDQSKRKILKSMGQPS